MSVTQDDITLALRDLEAELAVEAASAQANYDSGLAEDGTPQAESMSESEVQGILKQMIQDSSGGGDTDDRGVSGTLKLAMDYYFGRLRGDELPGRSWQMSLDVADMVESVLAEQTPVFVNDTNVTFSALSEDDEDQAQEESKLVNHVVMQQNNGYVLLYTCTKDGLLQKNGIVEVYVDEKVDVQQERIEGLDRMSYIMALQPKSEDEQVVLVSEEPRDDGKRDIEIKRVKTIRRIKCDPVPPEDFYYYTGWDRLDLQNCPFTARREITTRSELLKQGYDPEIVKILNPYTSKDDQVSVSRNQFSVNDATRYTSSHFATDPIEIYRCYAYIDEDGDGIAELRYIVVAGRSAYQILEDSPATHTPFASGTPYIQPHRYLGRSLFDKLWDVQDGKTRALRQWEDNNNNCNNRRLNFDINRASPETIEALANSRPGQAIPWDGSPGDAVMPVPVDDIGPSQNLLLNYFDRVAARRAGASLDMQSNPTSIPGNVGSLGVDLLKTDAEKMAAMMARNFAETFIRNLYLLVHRTARLSFRGQISVKVGSTWVNGDPSQWRARDDLSVDVGQSGQERNRKLGILGQILSQQMQLMPLANGTLVDDSKVHNTLTDFAALGGLSHPERYWIDPESPEAQQVKQQNAQQQQQQMMEQMQTMQGQIAMQQRIAQAEVTKANAQVMSAMLRGRLEAMKQELDRIKQLEEDAQHSEELEFKYAQLINQHQQWLTELEAEYGRDYSQQARENRPDVSS